MSEYLFSHTVGYYSSVAQHKILAKKYPDVISDLII